MPDQLTDFTEARTRAEFIIAAKAKKFVFLRRSPEVLATVKIAMSALLKDGNINIRADISQNGKVLFEFGADLGPIITPEISDMLLAHHEITQESLLRFELQKAMSKEMHPHDYDVTNLNLGGLGTGNNVQNAARYLLIRLLDKAIHHTLLS